MRGRLEQPLWIDLRDHPSEQLRCLDELEGHDPRGRASRKRRGGMNREARLLRPRVDALLRVPCADLGEQSRQERAMQEVVLRAPFRDRRRDPELPHGLFELAMDLRPLADTQKREKGLLADTTQ